MKRSFHNVEDIVDCLQHNKNITQRQYRQLERQCRSIVNNLFRRYKLPEIVYNRQLQEDVIDDITTVSLVKALQQYDPKRQTKFLTYYYSKARSMTEVEQGKHYRRFHLINTVSLPEDRPRREDYD